MVGTRGAEGKVSLSEPWLTLVFVPPAMEADDSIRGCLACCHAVAGGAGGVTGERKGKSTPPLANERKWGVVVAEYAYSPHIRALCRVAVKVACGFSISDRYWVVKLAEICPTGELDGCYPRATAVNRELFPVSLFPLMVCQDLNISANGGLWGVPQSLALLQDSPEKLSLLQQHCHCYIVKLFVDNIVSSWACWVHFELRPFHMGDWD